MVKLNSTTVNMTRIGICDRRIREQGNEIIMTVPLNAMIDLNTSIVRGSESMKLEFKGINLTANVSEAVTYRNLTNETQAPTDQRRISLFELESNLNYTNYTLVYDYSPMVHTLNDESTLKVWKCENLSSYDQMLFRFERRRLMYPIKNQLETLISFDYSRNDLGTSFSFSFVYRRYNGTCAGNVAAGGRTERVVDDRDRGSCANDLEWQYGAEHSVDGDSGRRRSERNCSLR